MATKFLWYIKKMSLFELIVIVLVAFLVLKPEDIPKIFSEFKKLRKLLVKTKEEIVSYIDPDSAIPPESDLKDLDLINYYLEKIAHIGGEYNGNYSLNEIKQYYQQLVQKKISEEKANNRSLKGEE